MKDVHVNFHLEKVQYWQVATLSQINKMSAVIWCQCHLCFYFYRRLQTQLAQQPFKPVFPTPAAQAPTVSHVPTIVSVIGNASSQSRRRSVPNQAGPMFCPHVSSSSQSQSAYAMPSFRSSGSAQSHFLNPPNPAQNPYQNLLSAAAAAASTTSVSSQSQSRSNPSHGNSNQNSSTNQNHNPPVSSTSSSSTAQQNNPFSNQTSNSSSNGQSASGNSNGGGGGGTGGGGGGGNNGAGFNNPNFPASFPLAQAHNHNGAPHIHPHPSPMHLSMHYSTYYSSGSIASRNPPYPPAPYSFPAPSLSSAAGASHLSGGNAGEHVHHVQAAHVQPGETATVARTATRLLPAHHGALQFYMQAAAAGGMAETVGVASYPPFLTPALHPPPLSPRH